MKKIFFLLFIILISLNLSAQQNDKNPEITAKEVIDHITYLSSEDLEGGFTGSEACYEAAEYITNEFESYGLKPAFGESYFQNFQFIETVDLGKGNDFSLSITFRFILKLTSCE